MKNTNQRRQTAFTLTELLVVIATIGIVAAFLFPAGASIKLRTHLTECFDNQRQLALGWRMYADDNNENIIGMNDGAATDWRVRPGTAAFTTPSPPLPANGQEANRRWDQHGYRLGGLYRYVPNPQVIHCPGDSRNQRTTAYGYTSYSGADGLHPTKAGSLSKASQVLHPADRFLWLEEDDSRSVAVNGFTLYENLGTWQIPSNSTHPNPNTGFATDTSGAENKWWDGPAAYHGNSSTFSFADGHVENHRWVNEGTLKFISNPPGFRLDTSVVGFNVNPDDLYWISSKYASVHWP